MQTEELYALDEGNLSQKLGKGERYMMSATGKVFCLFVLFCFIFKNVKLRV